MSSQKSIVDFIVEQAASAGVVSARKMFGEYAIYCDGKLVALVCDDQLFLKPTASGRAFLTEVVERPPYAGAKPYLLISTDLCENARWISDLFRLSAVELPMPKQKRSPK